jgi:outer membrane receptor for monomeric catechols
VIPGVTNIYVPSNPRDDTFYNGNSNGPSSVFYRHSVNEGLNAQNDYDLDFVTWTTLASYRHFDMNWVYPTNPGQGPAAKAPDGVSYPSGTRTYNPGQATYTPSGLDALHLTAGGRVESDYAMQRGTFTQFGTHTVVLLPQSFNTWHAGTYKVDVGYDLTANSLLYAATATAFKAGGYGYGPGVDPAVGPVTQPEHIRAYEIGSKNRFLDQTLQRQRQESFWKVA